MKHTYNITNRFVKTYEILVGCSLYLFFSNYSNTRAQPMGAKGAKAPSPLSQVKVEKKDKTF